MKNVEGKKMIVEIGVVVLAVGAVTYAVHRRRRREKWAKMREEQLERLKRLKRKFEEESWRKATAAKRPRR